MGKRRFTSEQEQQICDEYSDGVIAEGGASLTTIAGRWGCSPLTIRNILIRHGVPRKPRAGWGAKTGIRSPNWKGGRTQHGDGYVRLRLTGEDPSFLHEMATKRGLVLEHRAVMARHLGRALHKDENVHHINGIRDDNRLENLELWCSSQPPGSRVPDLVAWAEQLIERYQ